MLRINKDGMDVTNVAEREKRFILMLRGRWDFLQEVYKIEMLTDLQAILLARWDDDFFVGKVIILPDREIIRGKFFTEVEFGVSKAVLFGMACRNFCKLRPNSFVTGKPYKSRVPKGKVQQLAEDQMAEILTV